jgi:hypothetical protein
MTPEQINELFATKIWGWHLYFPLTEKTQWRDELGAIMMYADEFSPATNWVQAYEVLEKFCKDNNYAFGLRWNRQEYTCSIYSPRINTDTGLIAYESDFIKAIAIRNALIEALEAK